MPLDRDLPKREILPIPDRAYAGPVVYNAADPAAVFPPILPIRPPEGAPNVLIFLIDDVGFGASSTFGGLIDTPRADELAASGLKFNRFHTAALCSPTRAALLTGRNPHSVGMGCITEMATSAPGSTSIIPNSAASIAKILRYNGYSTAQFGKCHEVPVWETGTTGPFDHWPTYMGFEKFYGFVAGETNQYYPTLYDGTTYIEMPERGNYHLTTDLADQAIKWIETQKSLAPDKPFFMYFAPGATHAPHQVPAEWSDQFKGKFDEGWDAVRLAIYKEQKKIGVIPKNAELPPPNAGVPAWDEMPADIKDALKREMEIYAGFLKHTDHQIGRVIDTLKELGIFENTLILYILGDNGASAEGTFLGTFNEMIGFNGVEPPEEDQIKLINDNIDKFGTKEAYNHYAVGWAQAMCTPYQWTKQVASHFGGTRNGMVVHWPAGIHEKGGLRSQFTYVTDVLPTILEAIGLPEPLSVDGVLQKPIEGTSFLYTFNDADASERHKTQYFEVFGNRGIYHEGWTAVTLHAKPWDFYNLPDYAKDVWELYFTYNDRKDTIDLAEDWTQARNLAADMPEKLEELKNLFQINAARYNVFPLDDRKIERMPSGPADQEANSHRQRYVDGSFVADPCVINTFNRSFMITAKVELPYDVTTGTTRMNGVILARGNDFGGYGLYFKDGVLTYVYNYMGTTIQYVRATFPVAKGTHVLRMAFEYTGKESGEGGNVTLSVQQPGGDFTTIGTGKIELTNPVLFNVDAFLMVGKKTGGPLCPEFQGDNRFNGTVYWAEIEVTGPPVLVSPEHRVHALMAVQ
ncbi:arylsulfatase [Polyangium sorediatum]|uniref:Arylsulfatase n=1 Tax=Polyangium sorediatum TaxID=889274 RepID=A0ABT6NWA1_9BACT|nr:arylsulfatase [Polyangium sorediatum]MDI1432625.1 arylsulfatase [Polyangium sorediatum]